MKVALVYDRINKMGGAERVLMALHQIWPDAPLFTSVYAPNKAAWAKKITVHPSFLNKLPFARTRHEYLAPLMPYVFESFNLDQFDVVISVTSAEAKGVITKPETLHVCYMLTPTRYLWSHAHQYTGHGLAKAYRLPWLTRLRKWDQIAATRPDHIIPISNLVKKRIEKYYQRLAEPTIYPPVNFHTFADHPKHCTNPTKEYLLMVGRFVSYKKHLTIINYCRAKKINLIIVGSGKQGNRLKSINSDHISVLERISDKELACLYHHATAVILPQEEDFGIVALEAQSAGLPVIINNKAGAAEVIVHRKTGFVLENSSKKTLDSALSEVKSRRWSKKAIQHNARQYATHTFQSQFKGAVESLWQKHQT